MTRLVINKMLSFFLAMKILSLNPRDNPMYKTFNVQKLKSYGGNCAIATVDYFHWRFFFGRLFPLRKRLFITYIEESFGVINFYQSWLYKHEKTLSINSAKIDTPRENLWAKSRNNGLLFNIPLENMTRK